MKYWVYILTGILFCLSDTAQAAVFDKIYVFGDSLSDNGNLFSLSEHVLPQQPYYQGRFTNGPVWPEILVKNLRLSPQSLEDYALGGAKTSSEDGDELPGLIEQIDNYINENNNVNPDGIYVLWAGSNNYMAPSISLADVPLVIQDIKAGVSKLAARGARYFLIISVPDISLTPWVQSIDASRGNNTFSTLMKEICREHNLQLAQAVSDLQQEFIQQGRNDTKLMTFDTYSFMRNGVDNPMTVQVKNVKDGCFTGNYFGDNGNVCSEPEQYLFWDKIHPTTKVHGYIAGQMQQLLAENDLHPMHLRKLLKPSQDRLKKINELMGM